MKVSLNVKQEELKNIIKENLSITKDWQNQSTEKIAEAFSSMKRAAHELHMQLEPRPKHHKYMIQNREMEPEDPEFYNHIHPVEDLLAYLEDTSANDDPEDITLNCDFDFNVYSNRWGHHDWYKLTRTENGWYINAGAYEGEDEVGKEMSIIKNAMSHDSISFPRDIDSYLTDVWKRAKNEGLTKEEVQEKLNKVADWISETERNAPIDILL